MLFDFTTLPPADRYKLLASTIVPRPIAWVVSLNPQGRLNAAPYSFFNVFCEDPPLVGIGIGGVTGAQPKDTAANIRATGEFVVNLVPAALMEAMHVTAIDFERSTDRERCHIDTPKLDLVGRVHGGGGYLRASGPGVFELARIKLRDWAGRA